MYWHDGMGYAGWWGIGLAMLFFWALVIVGVVLLVRWAGGSHRTGGAGPVPPAPGPPAAAPPDQALRILGERFARGEIDEEEYRRRRDILRGG
jgi:putative membrane protein